MRLLPKTRFATTFFSCGVGQSSWTTFGIGDRSPSIGHILNRIERFDGEPQSGFIKYILFGSTSKAVNPTMENIHCIIPIAGIWLFTYPADWTILELICLMPFTHDEQFILGFSRHRAWVLIEPFLSAFLSSDCSSTFLWQNGAANQRNTIFVWWFCSNCRQRLYDISIRQFIWLLWQVVLASTRQLFELSFAIVCELLHNPSNSSALNGLHRWNIACIWREDENDVLI
jgi:hypothetical protein